MRGHAFQDLVSRLGGLTHAQLTDLIGAAQVAPNTDLAVTTIEAARAPLLACPRCHGHALHRHGHANGLQRFRCRACARTFNSLSGTPLARLRCKGKWIAFAGTMLDPATTVRHAAEQSGVHRSTSFRWRHRFLTWARLDRRLPLAGVVEADEMYLLESQKGSRQLDRPPRKRGGAASKRAISSEQVCVLVARDRTGSTFDAVPGRGPFHVQNVNAYHSRMRIWLGHFCGVASRYLANYCGWRWAIDGARISTAHAFLRIAVAPIHS